MGLDKNAVWEDVVRIVYPVKDAELTLPLYALDWTPPVLPETTLDSRVDMRTLEFDAMNQSSFEHLVRRGVAESGATGYAGKESFTVNSRSELRVRPGMRTSLCTYFNAFPAGYWRRWTAVDTVRLSAEICGKGTLYVYKSNGRGLSVPVGAVNIDTQEAEFRKSELDVPMTGFMDGGYIWLDIEADEETVVTVRNAAWQVPQYKRTVQQQTTLSIAITTFNRPSYCLDQLIAISRTTALRQRLDTVYCTDQGTDLVQSQDGFSTVAEELGKQLTYIRQQNLGGSGGFSRGMYETVKAGKSTYTLLLDDDAVSEPEAILRAVQFADYAVKPVLVGGGMLHLDNRTILYTQGERIDPLRMWMHPSRGLGYNHDFAVEPLRDSPERHQRIDEDFNGWWMCLIPVKVLKEIGLSMPVFIKFDDIEFGLRAKNAGYPTVCLPGVAVWHQAWHGKDNARTWEEYFTNRNRWIAALTTQSDAVGKYVVRENIYSQISLGVRFIYSAMVLRNMALRDILRGPAYIAACLPTKLGEVRKVRSQFTDAQVKASFDEFPTPEREIVSPRYMPKSASQRHKLGVKMVLKGLLGHTDPNKMTRPDTAIDAQDTAWTWLAFAGIDSALVTAPDGDSVAWFKRDDRRFRKELFETIRLSRKLQKNWKKISAEYKAYNLPSIDNWAKIFETEALSE